MSEAANTNKKPFHIPRWDELPNFEIYMEQLVSSVNATLEFYQTDFNSSILTSAMVNNYVKMGIIPKPTNKRYDRDHLAMLTIITLFKNVIQINDIKDAIEVLTAKYDVETCYNTFADEIEYIFTRVKNLIDDPEERLVFEFRINPTLDLIRATSITVAGQLYSKYLLNEMKNSPDK